MELLSVDPAMIPPPADYEIHIAERLEDCWRDWFPGFAILVASDGDVPGTLLRGVEVDQAALFGLLARVRDLNLTLLEVRCTGRDQI